MKKLFTLLALATTAWTSIQADRVEASLTLPSEGTPEHLYTMVTGNGHYANSLTAPTQTTANYGQFAFYEVDGKAGHYYIYSQKAGKWLTYTPGASYNNGTNFVKMADERADKAYFKVNNYSGDLYEISPITTSGTINKYLNWYQGIGANPLDGGTTLGLWEQGGAQDGGSRWTISEVEAPIVGATPQLPANLAAINASYGNATYTQALLYPIQQDAVGAAALTQDNEGQVITLHNNVLAASFVKDRDYLWFGGCGSMDLVAGTELFTVGFGSGLSVPASAMTLQSVETKDLAANPSAVGGAEHYAGKAIEAVYTYSYKGAEVRILWRAVLRDGSHYLRTEMELTGVQDVDMYDVIAMQYNVDTQAAGSKPATVGNTRGAVVANNKIFAGLETPTAYNSVEGEANAEDKWQAVGSPSTTTLAVADWTQEEAANVPHRIKEVGGAERTYYTYTQTLSGLAKDQKVVVSLNYKSGAKRFDIDGCELLDGSNSVAASDYHHGYSGSAKENNTYTFYVPNNGDFRIRLFVDNREGDLVSTADFKVEIYEPKPGVEINQDIMGIQGRWSRNTTLQAGQTWKVASVVGLIAQDGRQNESNFRKTQKRRSFLAYSERERAVPWRAFPCYISWYELNINRNNAAPGQEHTNFTAAQVLDVLAQWKSKMWDKYGVGPASFVIDDGWDNYGTWTFHTGFPNEMKDMAAAAADMEAGVGAWLGPVGGYGQSGNYRRNYWSSRGGMQLSNPDYYQTFLAAAENLVKNQHINGKGSYNFFKFDGISAQFSSVGPDNGDTGNENAEGIIRLEQYVRENLKEDIFFNTTVGTWASPFWYQITDATWRQENDHGEIGNNSNARENWITYRDRLVYQNYVQNSPFCPINTLMTHGFILTSYGPPASNPRTYKNVLNELRCAFACGSGMVELYNDYALMNSINNGKLWGDLADLIKWQKANADVLMDAHWVGGNPWTGSQCEVYGWAAWNGTKATLALRNGASAQQTYTFTLREALEIPANVNGTVTLTKPFSNQATLKGLTEGEAIDIDTELTVTLSGSSVYMFDGTMSQSGDTPTAILPQYGAPKASQIYDLAGRRLSHAPRTGIYIKDGQKVVK